MRFGSDYLINLRGKVTSCHRSELEIIDKRRGFRQGNYTILLAGKATKYSHPDSSQGIKNYV